MKKKLFIAVTLALSLLFTGCSEFDYSTLDERVTVKGYNGGSVPADLVIPSDINGSAVTTIEANSFYNQSGIRSIALPNSLQTIKSGAFENCINLSRVVFPNSLVSVGDRAFKNCPSIEQLTFGENMKSIGSEAFANWTSLKSIDFKGANVDCIAEDAFSGCTNIESVSLTKAFIDTYIVSETAPSGTLTEGEWWEIIEFNMRRKWSIPIPLTELIPSIKKITVDGVNYSIEDFNQLWYDSWDEHFPMNIHTA